MVMEMECQTRGCLIHEGMGAATTIRQTRMGLAKHMVIVRGAA